MNDYSQFDVLVIGSGAAGLYAALCLNERYKVGLITKSKLKTGASRWAQGGIAAAIAPDDSPLLHIEDTLKAGAGLCDRVAVDFLVTNGAKAIASLLDLGVAFDRKKEQLAMTLEAAHSRPRVLHAADTTGKAIVTTLMEQVLDRPNITVLSQAFALKLWLNEVTRQCQGISVLYDQKITWIRASAVILATGGGGQVFAQTTNPTVSTGDGVAIAYRSGATVRDLEFVQFHPTALTKPGAPRFLISEAVRGEGAYLIDQTGRRFAFDYHPDGELAARDIVSRAIFTHLQKTGQDHVYLDLRPIPEAKIRYRFPNIIKVCSKWGVDVFKEPIPVAPAAHYWMGGIQTDTNNLTSIPGLYAVGETASTGVHGANRLASNSLLECIVYAQQLSNLDIEEAGRVGAQALCPTEVNDNFDLEIVKKIRAELPILVWQSAGICRTEKILVDAIAKIQAWRTQLNSLPCNQYLEQLSPCKTIKFINPEAEANLRIYVETLNLLDIAYLILQSAKFRTESRGGHYRLDYPQADPNWQVHTVVTQDIWVRKAMSNE